MFNKKLNADAFTNLIAYGTTINGTVEFSGIIKIQGSVQGDVVRSVGGYDGKNSPKDCIFVDGAGVVNSVTIEAHDIIIGGIVTSKTVKTEGTVRILKSATVTGADIYYRTLEIEPGARLHDCRLHHMNMLSDEHLAAEEA
jgi:cytoskeletal protein CcmA (bactofilin family)